MLVRSSRVFAADRQSGSSTFDPYEPWRVYRFLSRQVLARVFNCQFQIVPGFLDQGFICSKMPGLAVPALAKTCDDYIKPQSNNSSSGMLTQKEHELISRGMEFVIIQDHDHFHMFADFRNGCTHAETARVKMSGTGQQHKPSRSDRYIRH
jgi:hypothetical protein